MQTMPSVQKLRACIGWHTWQGWHGIINTNCTVSTLLRANNNQNAIQHYNNNSKNQS